MLGRAWVGAILLAGVTSLPELVSGVTAVTVLNAPNLAIGGIVGWRAFKFAFQTVPRGWPDKAQATIVLD